MGGLAERLKPGGTLVLSAAEPLLQAPPRACALRCENAFFYVRTPNLLAVQPLRSFLTGGPPSELPPSVPGRQEGCRLYPAVMPPAPADKSRESGVVPALPPAPVAEGLERAGEPPGSAAASAFGRRRDSGRFPAVAPEPRTRLGALPRPGLQAETGLGPFPRRRPRAAT